MYLTWLLPRRSCALSLADAGPQLRPHCGSWWWIMNQISWSYWRILYRVGSWLWIVVVEVDLDDWCGLWWQLVVVVDPDRGQLLQDCLIYNMPTQIPLLTITPQFIYFPLCYKLYFADVLCYAWHLVHFCPSHVVSNIISRVWHIPPNV